MTRRLIAAISLIIFLGALLAAPAAAVRPGHSCPPASTSQLVAAGGSCHDLGMPVCQSALGCVGTVAALQPVAIVLRITLASHQSTTPTPAELHDLFEAGPPTPPPDR